ncbi:MAG: Histidine kinase [Actinomycetia bacterium]|nr:Histidine kinase [Actinomycetes bacterium]
MNVQLSTTEWQYAAVTAMVLNAGLIPDTEEPGELHKLATTIEDKGVQALTELRDLLTRRDRTCRSPARPTATSCMSRW